MYMYVCKWVLTIHSHLLVHHHFAVTLSSPATMDTSGATVESDEEDESFLFYALSATLTVLTTALAVVMIIMGLCCYSYHKRLRSKPLPTQRLQSIATATHPVSIRIDSPTISGLGERTTSSEKMADISKIGSCNTVSTCAQLSSPESTVWSARQLASIIYHVMCLFILLSSITLYNSGTMCPSWLHIHVSMATHAVMFT